MWLQAFDRAIVVANSVDHHRLAEDAAYRQRLIDMLQCDEPSGPSPIKRFVDYLSRFLPKAV
jgi:hypothetical protein